MPKFYITTAIPYVNAKPHVGHALEFIQADVIARYHRIMGNEVTLLSGGDENALKNVQAAEKAGIPIQKFVDDNSALFAELAKSLHVQFDVFQQGSSIQHHKASQKLWELCNAHGDIYKKTYTGLYCVGCELFYEKDELDENGECFEHPGKKLEEVSEENYFFRLSTYQDRLIKLIESDTLLITPQTRKNEALSFLKKNILEDISISRSNKRAKGWGVPVPGDDSQRMYVWFDALNIYQSGVGFGWDEVYYKKWWPADVHVIGKGILRFHAIYWPAFLMSAQLPLPKSLFVHGYFTVNGQKMSKSIGNVIDPLNIINVYGVDGFRYYVLSDIPSTSDGDFSEQRIQEVYNADLANGIGNLVSRIAKLCESANFVQMSGDDNSSMHIMDIKEYTTALQEYRFNGALQFVFNKVTELNQFIDKQKPWNLLKVQDRSLNGILNHCVDALQEIAVLLEPFLPQTAEKIMNQFKGPHIKAEAPLFPRIS